MANMTGSVYFSSISKKSDLPAEDGEKAAYELNWFRQEHSPLKLTGLGGVFLMAEVGGCASMSSQALGPLRLSSPRERVAGNVCLKAMLAS